MDFKAHYAQGILVQVGSCNRKKKVLQAALIGNFGAYKRTQSDNFVLTRRLNRRFMCLQEGLIGDFGDYKRA